MILDENEVIPFQKSPWNALCKNGICILGQVWYLIVSIPDLCTLIYFVKDTPFFKSKFKDDLFIQTPQHHNLCTFNSPFMFQKSLGYAIKKFKDSTEFQKKSTFSKK